MDRNGAVPAGTPDPNAPLAMQEDYGKDPGIQMQNKNVLQLRHRAKFANLLSDRCNSDLNRKYFYIWENAIEWNDPSACACWCPGIPYVTGQNLFGSFELCVIPPNCILPGADHINKMYFDRGLFDHQNCCWSIGFYSGTPRFHANEIKHVCCFNTCPQVFDEIMSCYFPELCGERVRYVPADSYCWCCSIYASPCSNCYGICGIQTGEPTESALRPVTNHLAEGEAKLLADSFNITVEEWSQYSGKK